MNLPEESGRILQSLRSDQKYSVHCIVSDISLSLVAETLRSVGVSVSLTHDAREVDDFLESSQALLLQLGSLSELKEAGMMTAIDTVRRAGKPWVLDPRYAHRSIFRAELARRLAENRPKVICGKPMDLISLRRSVRRTGLQDFATSMRTTLVSIGPEDEIIGTLRSATVHNHSDLMDNIVAVDCALSALCAAFCTVEADGFKAACCALLVARIAGERAGRTARGTGSFPAAFLDELWTLTPEDIVAAANLETRPNPNL
jgi:hydroxyethylthiazole kinase